MTKILAMQMPQKSCFLENAKYFLSVIITLFLLLYYTVFTLLYFIYFIILYLHYYTVLHLITKSTNQAGSHDSSWQSMGCDRFQIFLYGHCSQFCPSLQDLTCQCLLLHTLNGSCTFLKVRNPFWQLWDLNPRTLEILEQNNFFTDLDAIPTELSGQHQKLRVKSNIYVSGKELGQVRLGQVRLGQVTSLKEQSFG